MSADPRIEAAAKAFYGPAFDDAVFADAPHAQEQIKAALSAADAVTFSEEAIWRVTLELVKHYRLEPNTPRDRCVCGHKTPLGKMFHEHVARAVTAALQGGAA